MASYFQMSTCAIWTTDTGMKTDLRIWSYAFSCTLFKRKHIKPQTYNLKSVFYYISSDSNSKSFVYFWADLTISHLGLHVLPGPQILDWGVARVDGHYTWGRLRVGVWEVPGQKQHARGEEDGQTNHVVKKKKKKEFISSDIQIHLQNKNHN